MTLCQPDAIQLIAKSYSTGDFQQLTLLSSRNFISFVGSRGHYLSPEDLDNFAEFLPSIMVSDDGEKYFHPYQIWIATELRKRIEPNTRWSQWRTAPEETIIKFLVKHRAKSETRLDDFRSQTPRPGKGEEIPG